MTTNLVVAELLTLLVYRFDHPTALQAASEIYASHAIQIIPLSTPLELEAPTWLERFADQQFSMTDACSFAMMTSEHLQMAFTFDHHFTIAGFELFRPLKEKPE